MACSHRFLSACAVLLFTMGCGNSGPPSALGSGDGSIDLPLVGDVQFPPLPDTQIAPDASSSDDGSTPPGMDASTDGEDVLANDMLAVDVGTDGGTPPFCNFTPSQMNALAVILATCTNAPPQPLLTGFYDPTHWEGGPFQARTCPELACAAAATGPMACSTALGYCLKYLATPVADGGTCTGVAPGCSTTYATSCANGYVISNDCQAIGDRCVATSTQSACAPMLGDPCSINGATRCNGTVLESCVSGVYVPQSNCALTASHCDPTMGACIGTGSSCTGTGSTCSGTALVTCRGGLQQQIDCGALVAGAQCRSVGASSFCGVGSACDPTTAAAGGRCEGNVLNLCAGGVTLEYDCTEHGFTACGVNGCVQ